MQRLALGLLVLVSLCPLAFGSEAASAPENVVAAIMDPTAVLVTWAPVEDATSYRVYGIDASGAHLLADGATATAAGVPGGYDQYGVSAIVAEVESRVTVADYCVRFMPPGSIPPFVIVDC